jgi:hypothetical protein
MSVQVVCTVWIIVVLGDDGELIDARVFDDAEAFKIADQIMRDLYHNHIVLSHEAATAEFLHLTTRPK